MKIVVLLILFIMGLFVMNETIKNAEVIAVSRTIHEYNTNEAESKEQQISPKIEKEGYEDEVPKMKKDLPYYLRQKVHIGPMEYLYGAVIPTLIAAAASVVFLLIMLGLALIVHLGRSFNDL